MGNSKRKSLIFGAGLAAAAALPAYYLLVRPWHARWGATGEEVQRPMPGDDLVPGALDVSTRAVSIRGKPEDIWPWLVQMGYQRGGMYSYDGLDELLGILDSPSATEILPEFQHLEVGDVIPMGTGPDWPVVVIEPYRSIVLDIRDTGVHISWSFGLYSIEEELARLILRIRIRLAPLAQAISFLPMTDLGSFLMTRKMLLGLQERAEATAQQRKKSSPSLPADGRG